MKKEMTAEQKEKKAAYDKAYREKKKAQAIDQAVIFNEDKFEKSFDFAVRLYRNLKMEITNSYNASPGSVLSFVKIKNENNVITYRVKRTGRRTFYTTSKELVPAQ
jgi:hypothetical protein